MMESFFKDLVCHGDHNGNDSFNDSISEGESPRDLRRIGTMVMTKTQTSKALQGRRSSNRSLQKDWSSIGADDDGQIPVWEDNEPLGNDEQAKLDHIAEVERHLKERGALEDLDDFDFPPRDPAITRIPKNKRLSFPDENEGVNTVHAGYNPDTDRCKAMDMATKQAALREIEARRMLGRGPGLGAPSQPPKSSTTPRASSKGKLGFGSSSSRRLDSLPTPSIHSSRGPSPMRSSRGSKRCELPEPPRGPGAPTAPSRQSSVPQKPQGSSPTPRTANDHLTTPLWGAPSTPQRQSPSSVKSPSFVLGPGPPRCPSMAVAAPGPGSPLSPQSSRPTSKGPGGDKRRNSYVQRQESFSVSSSNIMDTYAYHDAERQRLLARFLPVQNNSFVPPPSPNYSYVAPPAQTTGNSWVPPTSLSRSNSYVPPLQSSAQLPPSPLQSSAQLPPSPRPVPRAMVVSGSRQNLASPEVRYPSSMEKVRDAGLAMCAQFFAPPPRMLSFEAPPAMGFESISHRAAVAPPSPGPPRRMMSCERPSPSPQPAAPTSAFPFPLPSAPPPLPTFSFEAMLSPFVQRANSYEPPLIRH